MPKKVGAPRATCTAAKAWRCACPASAAAWHSVARTSCMSRPGMSPSPTANTPDGEPKSIMRGGSPGWDQSGATFSQATSRWACRRTAFHLRQLEAGPRRARGPGREGARLRRSARKGHAAAAATVAVAARRTRGGTAAGAGTSRPRAGGLALAPEDLRGGRVHRRRARLICLSNWRRRKERRNLLHHRRLGPQGQGALEVRRGQSGRPTDGAP